MKILQTRAGRKLGFTLLELMIGIGVIAVLALILFPSFTKSRAQSNLTACKSNVRNMGTACEMYAIDHDGRYPTSLSLITQGKVGGYMKSIPSCPACGSDTYSESYAYATDPDAFTVRCGGANHLAVEVPAGYPLYDNYAGLVCLGDEGTAVADSGTGGAGMNGPDEVINQLNDEADKLANSQNESEAGSQGTEEATNQTDTQGGGEDGTKVTDNDGDTKQPAKTVTTAVVTIKKPNVSQEYMVVGSARIPKGYGISGPSSDKTENFRQLQAACEAIGVSTEVKDGCFQTYFTTPEQYAAYAQSEEIQRLIANCNNYSQYYESVPVYAE